MEKRWYSLNVFSNYEKKVAEAIEDSIKQENMQDEIDQVLVPTEKVVEIRRGKKYNVERRLMPGYVFVNMKMTKKAYHMINEINRVVGFLGARGNPRPIPDSEITYILSQLEEGAENPRTLINYEIGEQVNVTDGPFEGFTGLVEDVDEASARLKVAVSIFGRSTPIELEYTQVNKQI